MSDKKDETTTTETKVEPPKVDPPKAKVEEPKAEPPKRDDGKTKKKADDDGTADLDDLDERFDISKKALASRVQRASSKALKDAFGTDDPAKIEEMRKEHEALKKADEDRTRAALSEKERLEKDLETLRTEKKGLEDKLVAMEEATTVAAQDRAVRSVAKAYADPKYVRVAMADFADHVEAMSEKEAEKFGPDDAKKWFEGWAKDNPKLAKEATDEGGDADDKTKTAAGAGGAAKKVPLTTGHGGKPPPPPASGKPGKSPKDMSITELRAYSKSIGVNYPG